VRDNLTLGVVACSGRILNATGIIAILMASMLIGCSDEVSDSKSFAEGQGRWEYLWDAENLTDEWQALYEPSDLCMGPFGELIVADAGNSRLVRFTADKQFIEFIGRQGQGPGEFDARYGYPLYVQYSSQDSLLWVADIAVGRISRFRLTRTQAVYHDTWNVPAIQHKYGGFVPVDSEHIIFGSMMSAVVDQRFALISRTGTILKTFGEPWISPGRDRGQVVLDNRHMVLSLGAKRIASLWPKRAYIEIWTMEGELIASHDLNWIPDIQASRRSYHRLAPSREGEVQVIFSGGGYDPASDLMLVFYPARHFDIYGISPDGELKTRIRIEPYDNKRGLFIRKLVMSPYSYGNRILYGLDTVNDTIVRIELIEQSSSLVLNGR
jgi:hypothetical protein